MDGAEKKFSSECSLERLSSPAFTSRLVTARHDLTVRLSVRQRPDSREKQVGMVEIIHLDGNPRGRSIRDVSEYNLFSCKVQGPKCQLRFARLTASERIGKLLEVKTRALYARISDPYGSGRSVLKRRLANGEAGSCNAPV